MTAAKPTRTTVSGRRRTDTPGMVAARTAAAMLVAAWNYEQNKET